MAVTGMHHMLMTWTLACMEGHADLNHEHKKYSIISKTAQAMPIKISVRTVRLKVYILFSYFDDRDLLPRSQLRPKLDNCFSCTLKAISRTIFKLWHSNLLWSSVPLL